MGLNKMTGVVVDLTSGPLLGRSCRAWASFPSPSRTRSRTLKVDDVSLAKSRTDPTRNSLWIMHSKYVGLYFLTLIRPSVREKQHGFDRVVEGEIVSVTKV